MEIQNIDTMSINEKLIMIQKLLKFLTHLYDLSARIADANDSIVVYYEFSNLIITFENDVKFLKIIIRNRNIEIRWRPNESSVTIKTSHRIHNYSILPSKYIFAINRYIGGVQMCKDVYIKRESNEIKIRKYDRYCNDSPFYIIENIAFINKIYDTNHKELYIKFKHKNSIIKAILVVDYDIYIGRIYAENRKFEVTMKTSAGQKNTYVYTLRGTKEENKAMKIVLTEALEIIRKKFCNYINTALIFKRPLLSNEINTALTI